MYEWLRRTMLMKTQGMMMRWCICGIKYYRNMTWPLKRESRREQRIVRNWGIGERKYGQPEGRGRGLKGLWPLKWNIICIICIWQNTVSCQMSAKFITYTMYSEYCMMSTFNIYKQSNFALINYNGGQQWSLFFHTSAITLLFFSIPWWNYLFSPKWWWNYLFLKTTWAPPTPPLLEVLRLAS